MVILKKLINTFKKIEDSELSDIKQRLGNLNKVLTTVVVFDDPVHNSNELSKKENNSTQTSNSKIEKSYGLETITDIFNTKEISMNTKKNEWVDVDISVGQGVSVLGMNVNELGESKSALVYFSSNSKLTAHIHREEWEIVSILEGSCKDTVNDITLEKGDIYVIPKNTLHSLCTTEGVECYAHITYSPYSKCTKFYKISNGDRVYLDKLIHKKDITELQNQ